MRKFVLVLTLASLFVLVVAGTALAAGHFDNAGDRTMEITASNCFECHAGAAGHTGGPHGGYATGTDKCQACHDVHSTSARANENPALLMGQTTTAACQYCHDLTATWAGPYNFTGLSSIGAAHRVVGITAYDFTDSEGSLNEFAPLTAGLSVIPGGNAADGSEGAYTATKNPLTNKDPILSGAVFTCNSCHTPHGVKTVNKYLGESFVKYAKIGSENRLYLTNRILKQRPNNVSTSVYEYSSTWCLGCHAGRDDLTGEYKHNHPVEETAPGYRLVELALLNGNVNNGAITSQTDFYTAINAGTFDGGRTYVTFGDATKDFTTDPRTNQQFAMTPTDFMSNDTARSTWDGYDPIERKDGEGNWVYVDKGPACQQCHGSAREVEAKFAQDYFAAGEPARANFPHISANKALLTETADDFCTNCHDPNILP